MRFRAIFAGVIGIAATSMSVRADCGDGTPPVMIPMHQVPATGFSHIVCKASETTLASQGSNSILEVFRQSGGVWSFDTSFSTSNHAIAVSGDSVAFATGSNLAWGLNVATRQSDSSWTVQGPVAVSGVIAKIAMGPDRVAVSTTVPGPNSPTDYHVLIFRRTSEGLELEQALVDTAPGAGTNLFGWAIALDGDSIAVSSFLDSTAGNQVGAVHIFKQASGVWLKTQTIVPVPSEATRGFGDGIAMSGGRLAIGSIRSSYSPVSWAHGFVDVYAWNGDAFAPESHLTHPRGADASATGFGHTVAILGSRLLVGAWQDDLFGASAGAVYVFDLNAGAWRATGSMGIEHWPGAGFGSDIALSGTTAFVTAPLSSAHVATVAFRSCVSSPDGSPASCAPGIVGLFSYLLRWFQLDPSADFNRDGVVNMTDLMDYLNAWVAGCR